VNLERLAQLLIEEAVAIPACEAEDKVEDRPGLYAIFVDRASSLPAAFRRRLLHRATKLIYIGVARDSLQKRLVTQDLRAGGRSSFARSLGAVLGYHPLQGSLRTGKHSYSFKFSEADRHNIVRWIDAHLFVRTLVLRDSTLGQMEKSLIRTRAPLLNTEHNPEVVPELEALRDDCRWMAGGRIEVPDASAIRCYKNDGLAGDR
jgi:hypothetical protein